MYLDPYRQSAVYFNRARDILEGQGKVVTMQVFQKREDTVLCGVNEAVRFIKDNALNVDVFSLKDGDIVQPWEPVLVIKGDLAKFVDLESIYLGIMARGSKVATNSRRVVEAANGKPVYFFADRFDRPENQRADGYAAEIGGVSAVCTKDMQAQRPPIPAVGTMPHALIAAFGGDVVAACKAFRERFPDVPLHALVDFNNDCVFDTIRCAQEFGSELAGVRLDTSENMVDRGIANMFDDDESFVHLGDWKPTGVNIPLVRACRLALDKYGAPDAKITVSGGFNVDKIKAFEANKAPVDIYAVGSSILQGPSIDFTADVVYPVAKAGRRERDASRLVKR